MVKLENNVIPTLIDNITFWRRIVDDTVAFVKNGSIGYILGNNNDLPFLDRLRTKKTYNINTKAYRKQTNTDLYLNWSFHAPATLNMEGGKLSRTRIKFIKSAFKKIDNNPK